MESPIQSIIEEQQRRSIRSSAVPFISLNSKPGGKAVAAAFPGSAHVFLARKGSGVLDRIRAAVDSGEERFKEVITGIVGSGRPRRKPLSIAAMAKLTIQQPVFAELRLSGERVHSGLFVPPGFDALPLTYPYNGGPLPSRGLELVEYIADGATDGSLEALGLKCDPVLTKAEAAALKLAPKEQLIRSVAIPLDCETTYAAVAVVVVVAVAAVALAVATDTCGVRREEAHLSDETIRELGPGASARRLLEMRRKALGKMARDVASRAKRLGL